LGLFNEVINIPAWPVKHPVDVRPATSPFWGRGGQKTAGIRIQRPDGLYLLCLLKIEGIKILLHPGAGVI